MFPKNACTKQKAMEEMGENWIYDITMILAQMTSNLL